MRHSNLFEDAERDLAKVRYAQRAVGKIWRFLTQKTETTPLRDAGFWHVQSGSDELWMFPVTDAGLPHRDVMFGVGWRKSFNSEKTAKTAAYVSTGRDGAVPTINLIVLLDHDPANDTDIAWKMDWSILIHEFIHVLDYRRGYTRHKEKLRRMKASGVQTRYNDTPARYYNSPIEFNAYYQQGAAEILNKLVIAAMKLDRMPTYDHAYRARVLTNFTAFQQEFLGQFDQGWLRHFNKQTKQRFVKRLYRLFTMVQREWPHMAAIQDMMDENKKYEAEFAAA